MFKNLLMAIISIVCILSSDGYSVAPNPLLERKLAEITSQNKGRETDVQKLEDKCLELLKDHNSPENAGKIYAEIGSMYGSHGYSSPNDIRIAKTTEYCRKALELPLDVITNCEMYSRLSGSQIAPYWEKSPSEFVKARKESIVTCLTGLKLVLDNNAPKELGKSPRETMYTYYGSDEAVRKENQKKMEEQVAARKNRQNDLRLYVFRRTLVDSCVSLYSHKPYNTDELEAYARDILKGHDDAIDEIMSKTREQISQKGYK